MSALFGDQNVLVIGGAGFVGGRLVRMLLDEAPSQVVIVDNFLSAERSNVPDTANIHLIEGSIADDAVLEKLDDSFDYIFHLATYHGNQSSIHDPLADHENNTLTSLKLFNHVKAFRRLKKLVYASAGCTVAEKTFEDVQATQEDAPVSLYLDSPYQISKIIGELYGNYFLMRDGVPFVKARFQNVYGPGEILGAGEWRGTPATVWRNVTPTFIYRALKRLPLVVENEGIATRDFIYVDDIARGLMRCASAGNPGDVFNLASGVETSIRDLATLVNRVTENPSPIEWGPKRGWDRSGKRFGSTDKAKTVLGFSAQVGLADGLASTISWTRDNMARIDACIDKHRDKMQAFASSA